MSCNCTGPQLPAYHQQAMNAAGAMLRVTKAILTEGAVLVDDATFKERIAKCLTCPSVLKIFKSGIEYHRCTKCGCWLDGKHVAKAKLKTESCPLGHWRAA